MELPGAALTAWKKDSMDWSMVVKCLHAEGANAQAVIEHKKRLQKALVMAIGITYDGYW